MSHHQAGAPLGPYAKGAGWFSIAVGVAIIVIWGWLLIAGNVPEIEATPLATSLHIAGEVFTAILLIVAGRGLITATPWARRLHLLASGMLLLVVIHAVAWYGERSDMPMVLAFVVFGVLTIFFAIRAEE